MPSGIRSPDIIDLITFDPQNNELVLVISESGEWSGSSDELDCLLQKINNYISFVLGGQLERQYPGASGKAVRFQIDYSSIPPASIQNLLIEARNILATKGIKFKQNLLSQ